MGIADKNRSPEEKAQQDPNLRSACCLPDPEGNAGRSLR